MIRKINILNKDYENVGLDASNPRLSGFTLREVFEENEIPTNISQEELSYWEKVYNYLKSGIKERGYTYVPTSRFSIDKPIKKLNNNTLRDIFEVKFPQINSYKLNDELYNYIDYDNLIYYENVGRLEVENITSSSGEPEIITKRYYIIVNDLNFADYDSYSTFSNSWGFENRNILNRDREGFQFRVGSDGTKYIYFRVNQDKLIYLGDTWTERITNYLQINPLIITYELKEKQQTQITELDLKQLPFYNIGYSKGLIDSIGDTQGFTGILFSIFSGFATFFAIELFPNITIGAVILIPIVFGIIAFIIGRRKE